MKEEKNKKGLLIVTEILWVMVFIAFGWMIYENFFNNEPTIHINVSTDKAGNNKTEADNFKEYKLDSDKYDKEVKSMEDNYYAVYLPIDLSADELNLYNSLVTKNNTYGLYFNKNVNVNSISNDEMIEFAIINYINDNNLKVGSASCFMDTDEYEFTGKPYAGAKNCNVKPISKAELDNYIKEKYNTEREFVSDGEVKMISLSQEPIGYIFDENTNAYYYGTFPQSGGVDQISRWLLTVSNDENNIYFYDKAMYCEASGGWGYIGCELSTDAEKRLFEYVEDEYSEEIKELVREGSVDEESYDLNYDYVFEHYNLPVYKHTFKKASDGNYYWYSSELVK